MLLMFEYSIKNNSLYKMADLVVRYTKIRLEAGWTAFDEKKALERNSKDEAALSPNRLQYSTDLKTQEIMGFSNREGHTGNFQPALTKDDRNAIEHNDLAIERATIRPLADTPTKIVLQKNGGPFGPPFLFVWVPACAGTTS